MSDELAGAAGSTGDETSAPASEADAVAGPEGVTEPFDVFGLPLDSEALRMLSDGGPVIALIAALSIVALALMIWKLWRFAMSGAWSRRRAREAAGLWAEGEEAAAYEEASAAGGPVAQVVAVAMKALRDGETEARARERAGRIAKEKLAELRVGLRGLEVIVTIAPLLGLLGTVLGMIAAFQTLQESGARADPAALAGGIWEALLTTAAGMAVAIPAGVALNYFESVVERVRGAMESAASIVFADRLGPQERRAEAPRDLRIAE